MLISMSESGLELKHERVDDIPLLFGLAEKMGIRETVDGAWKRHHLEQGLSTGSLVTIWLTYLLSEADHRKSHVAEWVEQHRETLSRLTGESVRNVVEFSDDRLGLVLRRLSEKERWRQCEESLAGRLIKVHDLERVRLDTTTAYGYHSISEDGVMQLGHSKDHRPDLGQVKVMMGAVEPLGIPIATEVYPGQTADDTCYVPLVEGIRKMVKRTGLLYSGDSKMAALSTRAFLAGGGDFYLMPLPMTGKTKTDMEEWIGRVVSGVQKTELIQRGTDVLGVGYEFERTLAAEASGKQATWTERVLISRSEMLSKQQEEHLEKKLQDASEALLNLTPPPARGRRQFREEAALRKAVEDTLESHDVEGLLDVKWETEKKRTTRCVIMAVTRKEAQIEIRKKRLGWRPLVTNVPKEALPMSQCVVAYRDGWCIERDFHLLKDRPLGISPLFVRRDDQIIGLTHLLLLALRMLIVLETTVRASLQKTNAVLKGLYQGLPQKATANPTATLLLKAVARSQITLTSIHSGGQVRLHLTPLSPFILNVLSLLGLPDTIYLSLVHCQP